ncbi:MAG: hypothetical protein KAI83_05015 [Thiomargarita sp.]|nr:hypothetical protein [Thiomargarita sp.]
MIFYLTFNPCIGTASMKNKGLASVGCVLRTINLRHLKNGAWDAPYAQVQYRKDEMVGK